MEIKYHLTYKTNSTQYICVHHAGAIGSDKYSSSQKQIAEDIDRAHRARWNMISSLGRFGGYNFFIDKDGKVTQFRAIGEETMAQKGYNQDGFVISICLAGNFTKRPDGTTIDFPTWNQTDSLKRLVQELPYVQAASIKPHRWFGQTECFGDALADSWASNLFSDRLAPKKSEQEVRVELLQKLLSLLQRYMFLLSLKAKKLGGSKRSCLDTAK